MMNLANNADAKPLQFVGSAPGKAASVCSSTSKKQRDCLNRLKTLSQKYVLEKELAQAVVVVGTPPPSAVETPPPSESIIGQTVNATAELAESHAPTSTNAKQPFKMVEFLTDLVKNTTASVSCTNPTCGSTTVKETAGTDFADGFDASTFDSLFDMTDDGLLSHQNMFYGDDYDDSSEPSTSYTDN